jgi:hypothetical protein
MMSLNSLNNLSRKTPVETGLQTIREESNFHPSAGNAKGRYDSANNTVRTGRKPIRKIMADLQKRIESLQSSRAEYEALEAKINKSAKNSSSLESARLTASSVHRIEPSGEKFEAARIKRSSQNVGTRFSTTIPPNDYFCALPSTGSMLSAANLARSSASISA